MKEHEFAYFENELQRWIQSASINSKINLIVGCKATQSTQNLCVMSYQNKMNWRHRLERIRLSVANPIDYRDCTTKVSIRIAKSTKSICKYLGIVNNL